MTKELFTNIWVIASVWIFSIIVVGCSDVQWELQHKVEIRKIEIDTNGLDLRFNVFVENPEAIIKARVQVAEDSLFIGSVEEELNFSGTGFQAVLENASTQPTMYYRIIFENNAGTLDSINSFLTGDIMPPLVGEVSWLNCYNVESYCQLVEGVQASNVSFKVHYTGGNGGGHNGQIVSSTGVTGLTATLNPGIFENGSDSLEYVITGTPTFPSSYDTANFLLDIGGYTCYVKIPVHPSPSIGDSFQGGVVGYIFQQGDPGYDPLVPHGYIVSIPDFSGYSWGCPGSFITGANGSDLGTGELNSIEILNDCPQNGNAAHICDTYVSDGYNDWYLPSIDELLAIYQNNSQLPGFNLISQYWSSTQIDAQLAYTLYCNFGGAIGGNVKSDFYSVKAIRQF